MAGMNPDLLQIFERQGGVATSSQILGHTTRYDFEAVLKRK
jgi:hypothetical protein